MTTLEREKPAKSSKLDPILKRMRGIGLPFTRSKPIPVVPKITKESVLNLLPLLKSPKLEPMIIKMLATGNDYTYEEELSRIATFAIFNKSPEIIEELIELKVDLNQKVDYLKSETMLAIIVQYPYYHELFVKLVEAGAKTYCDSAPGTENFYSNTLYRSVTYDEFLNIAYLVQNKHCSTQDALQACYNQNKLHMLQYFLENSNEKDLEIFKEYALITPMSRQKEVLDLVGKIKFS
jgi:hypothetical protein